MTWLFGCFRNFSHSDLDQTKDSCLLTMQSLTCALWIPLKFQYSSNQNGEEPHAHFFFFINLVWKSICGSLFSCRSSFWFRSISWMSERLNSPVSLFIYLCAWSRISARRHIQDPASQRLTWNTSPKSVLVIKKIRDASLLEPFKELCRFLTEVRSLHSPPLGLNTSRWPCEEHWAAGHQMS